MHAIAGAIAVCTVLAARPAAAPFPQTQVTLRVVDELDQPIAASQFVVDPGSIAVLQDGTVDLDPGSYTVYVYPAILGATQGSDLYRAETIVVGASAETFEFPWTTADMRVDIVDQLGAPAAGSLLVHANGEWAGGTVLRLPVTEDPSQPAVQGGYADGYGVRGFPGMLGITQGSVLYRDYPPEELTSAGLDIGGIL